jgi:transcriptional regulator with XRE-family HTH domain
VLKTSQERKHAQLLAAAIRDVRLYRRMRPSEVARAMGLPLRTYERFEAGKGPITFDRLERFAAATNSDAFALLAVLPLGVPEFARRCADNKLMTIVMMSVEEMAETLGEDVCLLEAKTLINAYTRASHDLREHLEKRDVFAERWLEQRSKKIAVSGIPRSARLRRA